MIFEAILPVAPFGKQRPRVTRGGHVYTPSKTLSKEAELRHAISMEDPVAFTEACRVDVVFHLKKPKSAPKKRVYPAVKPDIDNLVKTLMDAGNGLLWEDDKLVVSCNSSKVYGDSEQIVLKVETMP